jgi:competence protein ComFC
VKCLICERFSLNHICKNCSDTLIQSETSVRKVGGIEVISFFRYSEIQNLLRTKETYLGYYILKELSKKSFREFSKIYKSDEVLSLYPVDDQVGKKGYSHTALLTKELSSKTLKPCYGSLQAQSDVKYKGKDLFFRKSNSKEFVLKRSCGENGVVVDDIVTTGSTLLQAFETLYRGGVEPKFALTLATV